MFSTPMRSVRESGNFAFRPGVFAATSASRRRGAPPGEEEDDFDDDLEGEEDEGEDYEGEYANGDTARPGAFVSAPEINDSLATLASASAALSSMRPARNSKRKLPPDFLEPESDNDQAVKQPQLPPGPPPSQLADANLYNQLQKPVRALKPSVAFVDSKSIFPQAQVQQFQSQHPQYPQHPQQALQQLQQLSPFHSPHQQTQRLSHDFPAPTGAPPARLSQDGYRPFQLPQPRSSFRLSDAWLDSSAGGTSGLSGLFGPSAPGSTLQPSGSLRLGSLTFSGPPPPSDFRASDFFSVFPTTSSRPGSILQPPTEAFDFMNDKLPVASEPPKPAPPPAASATPPEEVKAESTAVTVTSLLNSSGFGAEQHSAERPSDQSSAPSVAPADRRHGSLLPDGTRLSISLADLLNPQ
eukprot:TRINITY_DN4996_c0_g1_i1.p1 TRINITY_DN4996_c0_g1~~TRINITY_DN4996_c0_g1_i1.p1  ORF type:complete len:411 (-),score=66.19 TRINITY_DN4996_c0_g1_i1:158-1390(-)